MNDDSFSMLDLFREEVRSHSATLMQGLLELESDPTNPQRIEPLMRAAHSIKGAARIVNIDLAVQLAHVLEDVFVAAQEGKVAITPADTDVFLRGADILGELSDIPDEGVSDWSARRKKDIDELKNILVARRQGQPTAEPSSSAPSSNSQAAPATPRAFQPLDPAVFSMLDLFREEVRAHSATLTQGLRGLENDLSDPQQLEALMRAAHSIKGAARIVNIDLAVQLAHVLEEAFVAAQQGKWCISPAHAECLGRGVQLLGELGDLSDEDLADWSEAHASEIAQRKNEIAVLYALDRPASAPTPASPPVIAPPRAPAPVKGRTTAAKPEALVAPAVAPAPTAPTPIVGSAEMVETAEAVVRVKAQSLNRLVGLAGESLVQARWLQPFSTALHKLRKHQDHLSGLLENLAQALSTGQRPEQVAALVQQARQLAGQCRHTLGERIGEFETHSAQAEDLNTRLYREVIVSRMRPFADGAQGFPRMIRDLARQLGKSVRLEIIGQSTEVDRDILEKLEAPLTHMLRNAVDHAIELPEQRRLAGKAEMGVISIEVQHRAGMLVISVSDDGSGIDPERLRRKVVERDLTSAEMAQNLSEAELLEFLFLPGFSTASSLTEISGRGVGLDVVLDTVRKIGGSVHITSRLGQGTTFHLQMPITLSVLRAVLVDIGGEPYAFPHNRIDRLLRVPRAQIQSLENRQYVCVDGQNVGLVLGAQMFDLPVSPLTSEELPVLLMSDRSGQYGLIVESFRGEQDLVVKPLDPRLGKVPNVSAAALLEDGSPVLIADVEDLVRSMDQYIQSGTLLRCERKVQQAKTKRRILVVDDSITVREMQRQILRNRGYEVEVAIDGKEGWNRIRGEHFDLVISDVDMPRMTGLELVHAMRQEESLRNLPVIIVSYKDREEDRLRGLEVGANYYLTKGSFQDQTYLQAVMNLIGEA